MRIRTVCPAEDFLDLEVRAERERAVAQAWWAKRWAPEIRAASKNQVRAAVREKALADKAARIAAGELFFSRNDLLRAELGTLLRVIEWDKRRWKAIPEGVASRGGRRWGSRGARAKGEGDRFDAHVHVDVADDVGELIRRGCYWTSEQAVHGLRAWYDRHGRGPAGAADLPDALVGLYLMVLALKGLPSAEQMAERDGWRQMVVTPGDLVRRAVRSAGSEEA